MNSLCTQLAEYLAIRHEPFNWAGNTCAHWAAGWVRAATGRDPLRHLPECTEPSAWLRLVKESGGVEALVTRCLRCSPVPPAMAQIGDVVLLPGHVTGALLALCAGTTAALLGDDGASLHVPMHQARAAWRLREVAA